MINKLVDKIKKTNAPVVVGLDPMMSYIPEHITKKAFDEFGETLEEQQRQFGSTTKELSIIHMI